MNLEEAIEKLKRFNCEECSFVACEQCEINYEEVQAIKTVLAEIDRLKADLYSANTIIDDLVSGKEITLREGLNLIQKECEQLKIGECGKCPMQGITCFSRNFDLPYLWDIDNIIQAVDKLKEENNE